MNINVKNLVSISEANQNFSNVARMVDGNGAAVILKNNKPRYVLIEYSQLEKEETVDEMEIDAILSLSKLVKNVLVEYNNI